MSASTPTVIAGRYELQRRLAQGGMAEVWLATDLSLDRRVAVKWLKPNLATDEIVAERFRREAVAAASLDHPNIVAVHDVFEQDGRQAVVMQLIEGKSLRQLLDQQKRLSPELTCHIGSAVAAALDHAHEAGFVHRDVKPANIMIRPDGAVLLTDFGIAKGLHGDGSDDLTSDNIMMGTAKYLSPEQVRGKRLDGRADLYSLGLVLYECLAGRVPFLGETDADTALARLQRDPTDLAQLRATLPRRLVTTIHDLLARHPDRRPATGSALIAELDAARQEGPPPIDPTETGAERSPVAPFRAGRLRRAPSHEIDPPHDRRRSATPPRGKQSASSRRSPSRPNRRPSFGVEPPGEATLGAAPSGGLDATPRIPGQPDHVTGRTPITRVEPDEPTPATRGHHVDGRADQGDPTPNVGRVHPPPARGVTHSFRPSLIVLGSLLAIALVVGVILALALWFGGEQTPSAPASSLPADAAAATDPPAEGAGADAATDITTDTAATAVADTTTATIRSVATYDPDGDDGVEEDALVANVVDGDPSTSWRTSCYSNEWMGAKRGVGVAVTLDAPAARGISVDLGHAPSLVSVYASAAEAVPDELDAWGAPLVADVANENPATVVSPTPNEPVRHLLVLIRQLGRDTGCSDANPWRGRIAELRLVG